MAASPKRRLSLRDILTDGRIALMLPLGFSSGLPFLLVFFAMMIFLAGLLRVNAGITASGSGVNRR